MAPGNPASHAAEPARAPRRHAGRRLAATVTLLAASACAPSEPLEVEVGTGVARFESVTDGAELRMVCGSQGGQHIWVSIRTVNAGGHARRVAFGIADDAVKFCGLDFPSVDLYEEDGVGGITGMVCVFQDAAAADGLTLRLSAQVEDAYGRVAKDERTIVARAPELPCR